MTGNSARRCSRVEGWSTSINIQAPSSIDPPIDVTVKLVSWASDRSNSLIELRVTGLFICIFIFPWYSSLLETLISIEEENQDTNSSEFISLTSQIETLSSDVVILKDNLEILSSGQNHSYCQFNTATQNEKHL